MHVHDLGEGRLRQPGASAAALATGPRDEEGTDDQLLHSRLPTVVVGTLDHSDSYTAKTIRTVRMLIAIGIDYN